jgi:hypothetical protein
MFFYVFFEYMKRRAIDNLPDLIYTDKDDSPRGSFPPDRKTVSAEL